MITALKHRWYRARYFASYGGHDEQCSRIMRAWERSQRDGGIADTVKYDRLVEVHRRCGW
jgi:hypothetical protein